MRQALGSWVVRVILAAFACVLVVGLKRAHQGVLILPQNVHPEAKAPLASTEPQPTQETALGPNPEGSQVPTEIHVATRGSTEPAQLSLPEPSPYTRELVSKLTQVDPKGGLVTPEQAQEWKHNLEALAAQGAAGVPAIREFLALNREITLEATGASNLFGQSSLRSALISTLAQVNGPEATAVLVETLHKTTWPPEIAQLSEVLDQRAPGQYRQETVNAINEVLNMSSNGQLPAGWDVGALFKTLQTYGDSTSTASLQQLQANYQYYATMALAGLQGGEGVPVLTRELQDSTSGSRRDFALQMLAQVAAQFPDAGAALLEQARANRISDTGWSKIAMGLAGDQYQIGEPSSVSGTSPELIPGLKTFHIGSGNQNYYGLPLASNSQIQQRLALVDALMGATSSPGPLASLQAARATLSSLGPQ